MNKLLSSVIYPILFENIGKNVVFSPVSYLEAMHGLSLCASGQNLKELREAMDLPDKDLVTYLKHFKASLSLENYNSLLASAEYKGALNWEVLCAFREIGADFFTFASADEAVDATNALAAEKTHGRIRDLVDRSLVNEFTKFILLNCVYFKKQWLHTFDQRTYSEIFHGTTDSRVRFLHDVLYLNYYEDPLFDLVQIPYKDSSVSCHLFVPRDGLFNIIHSFDKHFAKIKEVKPGLQVDITIPPFKFESSFDLADMTRAAGVPTIFEQTQDWSLVDWSRLLPETRIWVQFIRQKAFIEVTKEGTEVAAATVIGMAATGCCFGEPPPRKIIRADKPFLYCLVDDKNKDIPLFVGLVNDLPSDASNSFPDCLSNIRFSL